MIEAKVKELEEKIALLQVAVQDILTKISVHESLQGQKETAIYNHIESVKRQCKVDDAK